MHIQWPSCTREGVLGTDQAGYRHAQGSGRSHARSRCPTTTRTNFRPSHAQPRRPRRPGGTDVLPGARAVPAPSAHTDMGPTDLQLLREVPSQGMSKGGGIACGLQSRVCAGTWPWNSRHRHQAGVDPPPLTQIRNEHQIKPRARNGPPADQRSDAPGTASRGLRIAWPLRNLRKSQQQQGVSPPLRSRSLPVGAKTGPAATTVDSSEERGHGVRGRGQHPQLWRGG